MSYIPTSWSTGDTITASALNKIENGIANAGSGYDFVITADWNDDYGQYENYSLESGTYSNLVTAIQNGTIIRGLFVGDYNGHKFTALSGSYLYSSEDSFIAVGFPTNLPSNGNFYLASVLINSDGTVDPD